MRTDLQSVVIAAIRYSQFERIVGIEPTSPTWKEGVMTIIRYSHIKELIEGNDGFEPSANRLTVYCSTAELIPQNKKPPNFFVRGSI